MSPVLVSLCSGVGGRLYLPDCFRGVSSTVRRVVEKQTGKQYAVKIIDISGERLDHAHHQSAAQTKADTLREVNILRLCAGHPSIS